MYGARPPKITASEQPRDRVSAIVGDSIAWNQDVWALSEFNEVPNCNLSIDKWNLGDLDWGC